MDSQPSALRTLADKNQLAVQNSAAAALQLVRSRPTTNLNITAPWANFAANGTARWLCLVALWDTTASGPSQRLLVGNLGALLAEPSSYTTQTAGSGAGASDAANDLYVGNRSAADRGWPGRVGLLAVWNRQLGLGELWEQQYAPHPSPGCVLFTVYGQPDVGQQLDLSGCGNHGAVTGAWPGMPLPARLPLGSLGVLLPLVGAPPQASSGTAQGAAGSQGQVAGAAAHAGAAQGAAGGAGQASGASARSGMAVGACGAVGRCSGVKGAVSPATASAGATGQSAGATARTSASLGSVGGHGQLGGARAASGSASGSTGAHGQSAHLQEAAGTALGQAGAQGQASGLAQRRGGLLGSFGGAGLCSGTKGAVAAAQGHAGAAGAASALAARSGAALGSIGCRSSATALAARVGSLIGSAGARASATGGRPAPILTPPFGATGGTGRSLASGSSGRTSAAGGDGRGSAVP